MKGSRWKINERCSPNDSLRMVGVKVVRKHNRYHESLQFNAVWVPGLVPGESGIHPLERESRGYTNSHHEVSLLSHPFSTVGRDTSLGLAWRQSNDWVSFRSACRSALPALYNLLNFERSSPGILAVLVSTFQKCGKPIKGAFCRSSSAF